MKSGELIVTGENSLHITLDQLPAEVKVYFKEDVCMVPCNPHTLDILEYEVHTIKHHNHNNYVLIIRWSVSGAREIEWHVAF
jgi:hypothetical protein